MCVVLPHMGDDEVGWRNEEVVDPLESCADGMMYFSYTGLRNYLRTCTEQMNIKYQHKDIKTNI